MQRRIDDGTVVGCTRFLNPAWPLGRSDPDEVEIGGTWLSPSAQRTPINTEAKLLLLTHAFEVWNVQRVAICTDARNEQSRRAIERLGAPFEGVLRRHRRSTRAGETRPTARHRRVLRSRSTTGRRSKHACTPSSTLDHPVLRSREQLGAQTADVFTGRGECRSVGNRDHARSGMRTSARCDLTSPPVPLSHSSVKFSQAVIVGLAAGLLGGLFGVGGGLIIVPGLVSLAGMDRRLAHGTSLAATLPIAAASLITYVSHGNVDWAVAFFLAIGAIAGAVVGTTLLHIIPKNVLIIIFVITVLATATRLAISTDSTGRSDLTVAMALLLIVVGLLTGTLAGLLGIGGGVIMVPAMVVILGMVPVVAKGTSVAVIVPTAIMGTIRNRKKANADIRVAAVVGGFGAISAIVGGTISDRMSDHLSNIMFALLLVFVAITQLLSLRSKPAVEQPAPSLSGERLTCSPSSSSPTRRPTATATRSPREPKRASRAAGHEVIVLDLYALGFRAAMTPEEREAYHGDSPILDPMVARARRARAARRSDRVRLPDVVERAPGDPQGLARAGDGARRRVRPRRTHQQGPSRSRADAPPRRDLHLRLASVLRSADQRQRPTDRHPSAAHELRAAGAHHVARAVRRRHVDAGAAPRSSSLGSNVRWRSCDDPRARRVLPPVARVVRGGRSRSGRRPGSRQAAPRCG